MNDREKQLLASFKQFEQAGKLGSIDTTTLSDAEKIGMAQSMEGMTADFETNVGGRMGPHSREQIDSSRLNIVNTPPGRHPVKGRYIGPGYALAKENERAMEEAWDLPEEWNLEPDSVLITQGGRDLSTYAHEFRHRGEGHTAAGLYTKEQHDIVYLMDAWTARTRSEWNDVVDQWANYKGIEKTPEKLAEVEQEMLALLKEHGDMLAQMEGESLAARYGTDPEEETRGQLEIGEDRLRAATGTPLDFNDDD